MKKIIIAMSVFMVAGITSCTKNQLAEDYPNPNTVAATTIDKQFSGFMASNLDYVMYKYWNYFVVLQNTALPWSQATGIYNTPGRYVPGASAVSDRWANFYNFLSQYKEFLNVYSQAPATEQTEKRIYMMLATTYFYDHTQKVVDLHGDIPWSEAGLLSTNKGHVGNSYAKYDEATAIYTKMLDDLKGFADELNTISVPATVASILKSQDFVNNGDITKWKKYVNSLRLRMLTRVSAVSSFQSRANSEIAAIVGNSSAYPVINNNDENISIKVYNATTGINNGINTGTSAEFYTGLIGFGSADIPSKPMIDFMKSNQDPRLRAMFQPGTNAGGVYNGLDPLLPNTAQTDLANGGTLSRYNFSTLSQNTKIPGMLMNAAEVQFLLAEYYLKSNNDAMAKTSYENGLKSSIDYYYYLRSISDNSSQPALAPTNDTEKNAYIASTGVNWSGTNANKLNLIATQKWINYSVLQPIENWTEIRRLNLPALQFLPDNANLQTLPPARWPYPSNEISFNTKNYNAVREKDKITTKLFWDID